ncbi:CGNR zinc finger domain-containing protein [Streptomyces sp. BPTC-684]|uniref:CGNR zinc finger domain-containing protein n=1 Tax=Streptomyces sp. BPTC-684 TaxID=3043734 RepID=UPI0024B1E252|nr:CGNR zinc finger domain-containing protein [Streptomyces sp. BPTC-684]WHM35467.1 CGNR zinc finger domain-containing protein [Streptomyces sp. BPTC-684]
MSEKQPSFIGGHPVLDFVNTVAWRTDPARRVERVSGTEGWLRWAVTAEVFPSVPDGGLPTGDAEVSGLLELRGALEAVLDAVTDGQPPPAPAWRALRLALLRAREAAALPPELPLRWEPGTRDLTDLRHALALRAEELLAGPGASRVRRCAGPGCGWFFLDRTRAGTRRWCSSGDCGNRDRARRHYARTHPTAPH